MISPGKVAVEVGRPALHLRHWTRASAGRRGGNGWRPRAIRVRLGAAHRGQEGTCRSLTGTDHEGRSYVFAQLRGGRSVVVRGGVEPPTFRFSGLRIAVQDGS